MERQPHPPALETAQHLMDVLGRYSGQRVLVAGVPCSGKSTLLEHIPHGIDMDTALFPKLSQGEKMFAFQSVLNPATGRYEKAPHDDTNPADVVAFEQAADVLQTLAAKHLKIEPGRPLFATLVIPSDVIVYIKIDDALLRERIAQRAAQGDRPQPYEFAKRVELILERQITEAVKRGVTVEEFPMMRGLNDR